MSTLNRTFVLAALLCALPGFLSVSYADDEASPSPAASAEKTEKYSAEELEEIVGPIALYPDIVISSLLPAATVPLDVVMAGRWLAEQEGEIGAAPEDSGWDNSVQALVQFPDVLTWMGENLDWLKELGYAVAVQQEDVLAAIQTFRAATKDAGNLESSEKQVVTVEKETIVIQPADPTVVYIPQYDYHHVHSPGYAYPFWAGVAAGALGAWAFNSIRWGGGYGYGGGSINVNKNANFNFNRNGGVNRPGAGGGRWNAPNRPGAGRPASRPNRGSGGAGPRTPNYNRPGNRARPNKGGVKPNPGRRPGSGAGGRPGSGRPGGGASRPNRPAPGAGNRPSGGSRPGTGNRSGTGNRGNAGRDSSAFGGANRSGSSARKSSDRGRSSVGSSRSGGSGGGASRGGGGGRAGGGGRGGGGRRR